MSDEHRLRVGLHYLGTTGALWVVRKRMQNSTAAILPAASLLARNILQIRSMMDYYHCDVEPMKRGDFDVGCCTLCACGTQTLAKRTVLEDSYNGGTKYIYNHNSTRLLNIVIAHPVAVDPVK